MSGKFPSNKNPYVLGDVGTTAQPAKAKVASKAAASNPYVLGDVPGAQEEVKKKDGDEVSGSDSSTQSTPSSNPITLTPIAQTTPPPTEPEPKAKKQNADSFLNKDIDSYTRKTADMLDPFSVMGVRPSDYDKQQLASKVKSEVSSSPDALRDYNVTRQDEIRARLSKNEAKLASLQTPFMGVANPNGADVLKQLSTLSESVKGDKDYLKELTQNIAEVATEMVVGKTDLKSFNPREIGRKIQSIADPSMESKLRIAEKSGTIPRAQNENMERIGINALKSYLNNHEEIPNYNEAVAMVGTMESDIDQRHFETTGARVRTKLGQYFYDKGISADLGNFGPVYSEKTLREAVNDPALGLTPGEKAVANNYVIPSEKRIIGTDIPGSGFFRSFRGAIENYAVGSYKSAASLTGIRTESDQAEEVLSDVTKTRGQVVENRTKWSKAKDGIGDLTGQVFAMGLSTKGLGGIGAGIGRMAGSGVLRGAAGLAGRALTNETVGLFVNTTLSTLDNYQKEAIDLMPREDQKPARMAYATTMTAMEGLTEGIFKDTKVLNAFTSGISPKVADLSARLLSNEITATVAKKEFQSLFVNYAKTFGKEFGVSTVENALEESAVDIAQGISESVFGGTKFDIAKTGQQALNTFITTAINSPLVAGLAAHGAGRRQASQSAFMKSAIGSMASNPGEYLQHVDNLEATNQISTDQANEKRKIIKSASTYLKELPENVRENVGGEERTVPMDEATSSTYLLHRLNEGILQERIDNTKDPVLSGQLEKDLKRSQDIRKGIFDGTVKVDENLQEVATTPEVAEELTIPVAPVMQGTPEEISRPVELSLNPQVVVGENEISQPLELNPTGETDYAQALAGPLPDDVNTLAPTEEAPESFVPTETPDELNPAVPFALVNKESKEYVTKTGNQRVVRGEDGRLSVLQVKDDTPVPEKTRRQALREYADNFDYTYGESAPDPGDDMSFSNEQEAKNWAVENTTSPAELAAIYIDEEKSEQALSAIDRTIIDFGVATNAKSYREFGDMNNMNNSKAHSYFRAGAESLDVAAQEMAEATGLPVTPEDIVSFMDRFPNGIEQARRVKDTDVAYAAANRFFKITGLQLTEEVAQKAIDQAASKIDFINNEIARDAYYGDEQSINDAYDQISAAGQNPVAENQATQGQSPAPAAQQQVGQETQNNQQAQPADAAAAKPADSISEKGKALLSKLGVKEINRNRNGNVKGGQPGWKIRINLKSPSGGSYFGKPIDGAYTEAAGRIYDFLNDYFSTQADNTDGKGGKAFSLESGAKTVWKHLAGGEVGESDFTIYIGSRADVDKFINDVRRVPEVMGMLAQGNIGDDTAIDDVFKGRFEGGELGMGGYHVPTGLNTVFNQDKFDFNVRGVPVHIDYQGNSLSSTKLTVGGKVYRAVFDQQLKKDFPEVYDNLRNDIAAQVYGRYAEGDAGSVPISGSVTPAAPSISAQGKALADKIRALKSKPNQANANIFGVAVGLYDGLLETVATAIEGGAQLADAINKAIGTLSAADRKNFDEAGFKRFFDDVQNDRKPKVKVVVGGNDSSQTAPVQPAADDADAEPETANRRVSSRILADKGTIPEAMSSIKKNLEYAVQTNAMSLQEAKDIIDNNHPDRVYDMVTTDPDLKPAVRSVLGQMLIRKYNDLARSATDAADRNHFIDQTIRIADFVSEKLGTEMGQAIQALSLFQYLSPEAQQLGAIRDAKRQGVKNKQKAKPTIDKIAAKMKQANAEAVDEITAAPEVKAVVERTVKSATEKAKEKIAKARERREKIIKKNKENKGGTLYASVGLTNEGIEYVGELALTYIQEGIANVQIVADKIKQHLIDTTGKMVDATVYDDILKVVEKKVTAADARLLNPAMKGLGLKINEVVKKHYTVAEDTKRKLAEKLVTDAGLTGPEADALSARVQEAFDRVATRKKRKILETEHARTQRAMNQLNGAKKVSVREVQDQMIQYSNLGAFESDFADEVAKKVGLGELTPDQIAEIGRLADVIQTSPEGSPKRYATEDLLAYRAKLKGMRTGEVIQAVWYANVLSGYGTHVKNVISTWLNGFAFLAGQVAQHPTSLPALLIGGARGVKRGFYEAANTLKTGRSPIHVNKVETPNVLERINFYGGVFNPGNWLKFVGRMMQAEDVVAFQGLKEMRATQMAYLEAKKNGTGNPFSKRTWEAVNDNLLNTPARIDESNDQVRAEGLTGAAAKRRFYELMEMSRPTQVQEVAYGFAAKGTFNHEPEGMLGALTNSISQTLDFELGGFRPIRMFVPFTRIITNVVNNNLDYTPVGLLRAMSGKRGAMGLRGEKSVAMTPEERAATYAKASLGIALTGIAYAMTKVKGDDGEPILEITGSGPTDFKKLAQLKQQGWSPFSVKFRGTYYSYALSPLILNFGLLGFLHDHEEYAKTDEDTWGKVTALVAMQSFKQIMEMTWIGSTSTLLGAIDKADPDQASKAVGNVLGNSAKGLLVPNFYSQIAQRYESIANMPQKQVNNMWQNMIQDIPVARNALSDKVNALGEPIKRDIDLVYSPENPDPVWKFIGDKKVWVAPVNKGTLVYHDTKAKVDRPVTENEYYEFSKMRGGMVRNSIIDIMENGAFVKEDGKVTTSEDLAVGRKDAKSLSTFELQMLIREYSKRATKATKAKMFVETDE